MLLSETADEFNAACKSCDGKLWFATLAHELRELAWTTNPL
jgi:hypothetical protein